VKRGGLSGFGGEKPWRKGTGRVALAVGKVSFWLVLLLALLPLPCAVDKTVLTTERTAWSLVLASTARREHCERAPAFHFLNCKSPFQWVWISFLE